VGYVAGEAKEPPLRPTFDRRIKLEFHGRARLFAEMLRRIERLRPKQPLFLA
jgi:hypothetical protein